VYIHPPESIYTFVLSIYLFTIYEGHGRSPTSNTFAEPVFHLLNRLKRIEKNYFRFLLQKWSWIRFLWKDEGEIFICLSDSTWLADEEFKTFLSVSTYLLLWYLQIPTPFWLLYLFDSLNSTKSSFIFHSIIKNVIPYTAIEYEFVKSDYLQ